DLCDRSPRKPLDENNRGFSHDSSALSEILSLARFDYASYRDSLRTFGGCNCSAPDYPQVGSSNEHLMKKILITGGAGFIGSHLVDRLIAEDNWRITVVDDFNDFYDPSVKRTNIESYLSNPNFSLVEADIRDFYSLEEVFNEGKFDCVVHLAARAGVRPSLTEPRLYV